MDDAQISHFHVLIEGRVQGVGFRYFVIEVAQRLGVTGWVRNTYDERVEVVAEGDRSALDQLLAALHRGPRSAVVTHLDVHWGQPTGKYNHFALLPSSYPE
jgi:acylphosphatase